MSQTYFLPQKRSKEGGSPFSNSDGQEYKSRRPGPNLLPKVVKKSEPELFRHFAGDIKGKLREIFEYLNSGKYPSGFDRIEDSDKLQIKKNKFFVQARRYFISKEYLSDVSQSKFCVKNGERVIPYQDEVDQILQELHIANGVHKSKKKIEERAIELKIFWKGYSNEAEKFIKACFCEHSKKLQKKMEPGLLVMKKKILKKKANKKSKGAKSRTTK